MRLNSEHIREIRKIANNIYGEDVEIVLFGSRTDDQAKGGDIDLLIESPHKERMNFENKVRFLTTLKLAIGDQKIDVVYGKKENGNSNAGSKKNHGKDIVTVAHHTGIKL